MNGNGGGSQTKPLKANWTSGFTPSYPSATAKKLSSQQSSDRTDRRPSFNKECSRVAPQGSVPPIPRTASFQRPPTGGNGRTSSTASRPGSWPANTPGFCRSTTEIACATDVEFDTVIFNWKINNFNPLRCMATDKGLPPEGDVLTSPVFLDNENSAWWLRLYPFEDREQHRGKVSLFLHTDRAKKGDVYFCFRFAALDSSSREVEDTGGGSALHKFSQSEAIRNYGFYDFIRDEDTLQNALFDDTLWVYCEVNIYTNPQTIVQDGSVSGSHADVISSSVGNPSTGLNPFGRSTTGFSGQGCSSSTIFRQPSVHGGSHNI